MLVINEIPGRLSIVAGHVPGFLTIHEMEVSVGVVKVDRRTSHLIGAFWAPG